VAATGAVLTAVAADFGISSLARDGTLTVTNAVTNGIVAVSKASEITGAWVPEKNTFSGGTTTQVSLAVPSQAAFYRAQALELTGPAGFTNLIHAYGVLTTVAGAGGSTVGGSNKWQMAYEGGPATNAQLSSPHITMADQAGNLYIADKDAHAIRKVTPDGLIHTVAGTGVADYGTTDPAPATTVALNQPNGLYVFPNGMFYILDRANGLIRKVDTNGLMTTVVDNFEPITLGRGLWVSPDESLIFYANYSEIRSWDTTNGLMVYANGFAALGNIAMDLNHRLVVTDQGLNQVYRIEPDLSKTVIAAAGIPGAGDGYPADQTALVTVRGIWYLPTGGCFLATDTSSQVWYVDLDGIIRLFMNGSVLSHAGDGDWFYAPTVPKVSHIRQITVNYDGDLLVTENDAGYVRKVRFLPYPLR